MCTTLCNTLSCLTGVSVPFIRQRCAIGMSHFYTAQSKPLMYLGKHTHTHPLLNVPKVLKHLESCFPMRTPAIGQFYRATAPGWVEPAVRNHCQALLPAKPVCATKKTAA